MCRPGETRRQLADARSPGLLEAGLDPRWSAAFAVLHPGRGALEDVWVHAWTRRDLDLLVEHDDAEDLETLVRQRDGVTHGAARQSVKSAQRVMEHL